MNDGFVNATDSVLTSTTSLTNNADADLLLANSTVNGPVINNLDSAVTIVGTVDFNGLMSGPGNFFGPGTINFNGGMAAGASPAEVEFEGDVVFGSTNDLMIELGGNVLGDEFDSLTIAGSAALGGDLVLELINDLRPDQSESFTILSAGSLNETFNNVANGARVHTVDRTGSFVVSYDAITNAVVLSNFFLTGDMDYDGDVDFDDIDDFVLGLTDAQEYENQIGLPPETKGDTDGDGDIDFDDIDDFVAILTPDSAGTQTVPEPGTTALLCLAVSVLAIRRWRRRKMTQRPANLHWSGGQGTRTLNPLRGT